MLVEASLWSADPAARATDLARIAAFVDAVHVDAGDGQIAPALFTPADMADLARVAVLRRRLPVHVHLMAARSAPHIAAWAAAGADLISVHAETRDLPAALHLITTHGVPAGLALTLDTHPAAIIPHLGVIDAIVMIGTPLGTKGTAMDSAAAGRLAAVRALANSHPRGRDLPVIADGGIRDTTAPELASAGADAVVAGSLLFTSPDPAAVAHWLRHRAPTGQPEQTMRR